MGGGWGQDPSVLRAIMLLLPISLRSSKAAAILYGKSKKTLFTDAERVFDEN